MVKTKERMKFDYEESQKHFDIKISTNYYNLSINNDL